MSCWGGGGPRARACVNSATALPLVGEDTSLAPLITMPDGPLGGVRTFAARPAVSLAGASGSGHTWLPCAPGAHSVNLRSLVPPQRLAQAARAPGTRGAVQ